MEFFCEKGANLLWREITGNVILSSNFPVLQYMPALIIYLRSCYQLGFDCSYYKDIGHVIPWYLPVPVGTFLPMQGAVMG